MSRLRISAISYLNTAPLMWDFEHGSAGNDFEISYTIPSSCAAALKSGAADIGIIPAAAYATVPDLIILPGVAIAARRPIRSILLISKVPLKEIKTIALDRSSMTSVALTKVLFAKWWGGAHQFADMGPNLEEMLKVHDAGLLIGDPALQVDRARYHTYDLAEEWIRLTGKPFVFAFWAVRGEACRTSQDVDLAQVFQTSRDHGLEPGNVGQIALQWAPRLGITQADVRRYLEEDIYYYLDADCLEGLQLFYRYAEECGILPPAPSLQFSDFVRASSR